MADARVLIVMGSPNDYETMKGAAKVLADFGVGFEFTVASAHRSPDRAHELASKAAERGIQVIIAGAGLSAHLAGVVAAISPLPVLGVPIDAGPMQGLESLMSTVQMPPGVPVGTLGIGSTGARNAGALAIRILALGDEGIAKKLADHRATMAAKVGKAAEEVEKRARDEFGG